MSTHRPCRLNLRAVASAATLTVLVLAAGARQSAQLLQRYVHALAPTDLLLKDHAMAVQRAAFAQPDLLPIYGSSELVQPVADKANLFFASYPTRFEVFPVGRAGFTSLVIMQKLAAIGPALRGKKVAISISPSWFITDSVSQAYYEGNFNSLAVSDLVFSSTLSSSLKHDAALRMLEFPHSLEKHSILAWAIQRLAGDTLVDRWLYRLACPLGKLQNAILHAQDFFESAFFIATHEKKLRPTPPASAGAIDWPALLAGSTSDREDLTQPVTAVPDLMRQHGTRYVARLNETREWGDLELLLRALHELGAKPLLLSMPVHGPHLDRIGVPSADRSAYVSRLRGLAAHYAVPLQDFDDHEDDSQFLEEHYDHLTAKGWLYFDKALDDFFHNRRRKL